MQHTLVAVFDNRTDAQNAMNELLSSGFSRNEVKLSNADPTGMTDSITGRSDTSTDGDTLADGTGLGIGASIKHFFTDLFGADDNHASKYEGAVTRGHHVLTVRADSLPEVERAADIVERYGPTDIDEQASGAGMGGLGATGGMSESMRASGAGGMQQSSRMSAQSGSGSNFGSATGTSAGMGTGSLAGSSAGSSIGSTSAAASEQLENPGDRKLFQQQSLNQAEPMGTTYQEPQGQSGLSATGGTSLQGSTLQENSVQSSALEGTQNDRNLRSSGVQGGTLQGSSLEGSAYQGGAGGSQQRDTAAARYTESQRGRSRIYSRSGEATGGGSGLDIGSNFFGDDDDYYRNHFLANYSGDDYEKVKPAYAYGSEMARSDKYRGRKWDEVENDLRSDWSTRNASSGAGDTWERMKAAVRRGWDRMTNDDDDTIYRSHFSSTYGSSGASYDEYRPAYSYGSEMARNEKYRGRRWDEVESDLSTDWTSRYGSTGSTWEKMKAAVRRGWDRMTLDRDDDSYYRSHYDTHLSGSGMDYDSVKPAYSYGSEMRKSELYRNRPWDDIEGDLRKGWDSRINTTATSSTGTSSSTTTGGTTGSMSGDAGAAVGGAWDRMKAAVRHGWEKLSDDEDDDAAYRSHWNATYSTATDGSSYDEYKPAYSYGSEMARSEKYRGRRWDEVESDLRTDWDSRYANGGQSTWEKMKAAVRQGWDRMTS